MADGRASRPLILASLTAADPLALGRHAELMLAAGVDGLHIDISDGRSVGFLPGTPALVAALRRVTDALLDVHLLVDRPAPLIPALADAGADRISVHIESVRHPWQMVGAIERAGARAGIALDAATPLAILEHLGRAVTLVNLQTATHDDINDVFIDGMEARIRTAAAMLPATTALQVDGGVHASIAAAVIAAGATELVIGRALVTSPDPAGELLRLRSASGTHQA